MWRNTLSWGMVLIVAGWSVAFVLIILGWALDIIYLGFLGVVAAAFGATMALAREHQQTRRQVYIVGMAGREPLTVIPQRDPSDPVSNIGRIKKDS